MRIINTPPPLQPLCLLKEHYTPSEYTITIMYWQAAQYEIKPNTTQLLPSFHGLSNEDPYNHIDGFLVICSTVRINNFSSEALKMFLFLFLLQDKGNYWLSTLPANSTSTWAQLNKNSQTNISPWEKLISIGNPHIIRTK